MTRGLEVDCLGYANTKKSNVCLQKEDSTLKPLKLAVVHCGLKKAGQSFSPVSYVYECTVHEFGVETPFLESFFFSF